MKKDFITVTPDNGTGAIPSEVLRMAEEANVEIVELDKDFSPTDIP